MTIQNRLTFCTNLRNIFISMKCTRLTPATELTSLQNILPIPLSFLLIAIPRYSDADLASFPPGIPCLTLQQSPGNGASCNSPAPLSPPAWSHSLWDPSQRAPGRGCMPCALILHGQKQHCVQRKAPACL